MEVTIAYPRDCYSLTAASAALFSDPAKVSIVPVHASAGARSFSVELA